MVPRSTYTASKQKMKPFNEGYQAFLKGDLGNPYQVNTKDNRDWEMGFNKAYFRNLDRVKLNEQKQNESRRRGQKLQAQKNKATA